MLAQAFLWGGLVAADAGASGFRERATVDREVLERIHHLWDELADFGAHETDAAMTSSASAAELV